MRFGTDETSAFFEVRRSLSKSIDDVQLGRDIVVTKHGKPVAALISAAALYRYREVDRLMTHLVEVLSRSEVDPQTEQIVHQVLALTASMERPAHE